MPEQKPMVIVIKKLIAILTTIARTLESISKKMRTPKEIVEQDGLLEVSITQYDTQRTKKEKIKIRPFVSEPARVTVMFGALVKDPEDQYQNARFEYTISLPCYPEEWRDVHGKLRKEVLSKVIEQSEAFASGELDV